MSILGFERPIALVCLGFVIRNNRSEGREHGVYIIFKVTNISQVTSGFITVPLVHDMLAKQQTNHRRCLDSPCYWEGRAAAMLRNLDCAELPRVPFKRAGDAVRVFPIITSN